MLSIVNNSYSNFNSIENHPSTESSSIRTSNFNKDLILDSFHDYMSQCVFYSLYLSFPKSRHKFNYCFKEFLISFFGYMFNGLSIHIKYNTNHWQLDLGSGNIIEDDNRNNDESLPKMHFMENLIKSKLKSNNKYGNIGTKLNRLRKKNIENNPIIQTNILNTPLYRMHAENLKFETLNMIKPIKLKQRKTFDTFEQEKIVNSNLQAASKSWKVVQDLRKDYKSFELKNQNKFNLENKEITSNIRRLNKELAEIKAIRNAEYVNYCIFINSK